MKVLHVVASTERRGAEIFAADLMVALTAQGVDQRLAILRGETPCVGPVPSFALISSRHRNWLSDVRIALRLRQASNAWRPDIVQLHGGEALKYGFAAMILGRYKTVYRRIGGAPDRLKRPSARIVFGSMMRRVAKTVTVAQVLQAEAINLFGVCEKDVITIPNGVDRRRLVRNSERFQTRRALGLSPSAMVLVSLGALTGEKDPLAHLDATASRLKTDSNVAHLFVGEGPLRSALERRIQQLGLERRVLVLGSRTDIADLLGASDILLFASRPDGMEGMPAVLIEAAMLGLPVVGFDVAGASEVVIDGRTGFLVPWGNRREMEARIRLLLDDPQLRAAMGRAAESRSRSFDIEIVAPQYLRLYESLSRAP
jgi:glycosyltransferase involved in cell wall biosynthesis